LPVLKYLWMATARFDRCNRLATVLGPCTASPAANTLGTDVDMVDASTCNVPFLVSSNRSCKCQIRFKTDRQDHRVRLEMYCLVRSRDNTQFSAVIKVERGNLKALDSGCFSAALSTREIIWPW